MTDTEPRAAAWGRSANFARFEIGVADSVTGRPPAEREVGGLEQSPLRCTSPFHTRGTIYAGMEPVESVDLPFTLPQQSVLSGIADSAADLGKDTLDRVDLRQYGMTWSSQGRGAIRPDVHVTHRLRNSRAGHSDSQRDGRL